MTCEAVIFDCDGVLVDSEVLSNQVLVDCATEQGAQITLSEALHEFTGGKMADCVAAIEARLGHALPRDFVVNVRRRMAKVFESRLQPVPGVESVVRNLQTPFCVASSGPREKIELSLGITGLLPWFEQRIFSAYEVGRWKPDPGLFLYAAAALDVAPGGCIVIEDSIPGVQAGIAAGMTVLAYAPNGNEATLAGLGARTFTDMNELPGLLAIGVVNPPAGQ